MRDDLPKGLAAAVTAATMGLLALLIPVAALIGWCAGVLLAPARVAAIVPPAR